MALDPQSLDRLRIDRESAPASSRRTHWVWLLVVLLLISVVWWMKGSFGGARAVEVRVTQVREVSGATAARTVLNASGYVTARREATVSAKQTGKVVEVLVEEGSRVEANQILARLDASNLIANKAYAEAQRAAAKSAIKETQALLKQAESAYKRTLDLINAKIATASDLDKAESDFRSLQAREQRQQLEVTVVEKAIGLWDQQLEDMIIRAPFAGVVTAKNAQPGEVISPMSAGGFTRTGICTLVDMESLEVEVDVNESYINRVAAGQPVEATLDAYPEWKIPAKVIAIIPTADRQKATVRVRVGFESLDPRMLPQMGVKVGFRNAEEPSASVATGPRMVVPRSAIQERDGKQIAWVLRGDRVERRAVRTESYSSEEVQVVAGLNSGDRLVLDPPLSLSDGGLARERKP